MRPAWTRLASRSAQVLAQDVPHVPSPCQSVCVMHPETGWCEGCMRTLQEIGDWSRLDDEARRLPADVAALDAHAVSSCRHRHGLAAGTTASCERGKYKSSSLAMPGSESPSSDSAGGSATAAAPTRNTSPPLRADAVPPDRRPASCASAVVAATISVTAPMICPTSEAAGDCSNSGHMRAIR